MEKEDKTMRRWPGIQSVRRRRVDGNWWARMSAYKGVSARCGRGTKNGETGFWKRFRTKETMSGENEEIKGRG